MMPSIETSVRLAFSCWRGAYPGLAEHFRRARLDPTANTWDKVYDFNSKDDLGGPHFSLDESVRPWWVAPPPEAPLEGGGVPECPVPAADGSLFGGGRLEAPPKSPGSQLPDSLPPSPGRAAAHDEEVELSEEEGEGVVLEDEDEGEAVATSGRIVNGGGEAELPGSPTTLLQMPPAAGAPATAATAAAGADADARAAWRVVNATQLAAVAREEGAARAALRDEAARRLKALQQTRAALLKQRYATNREREAAAIGGSGGGSDSGGRWERVLALVDLSAAAANSSGGAARAAGRSVGGGAGGPSKDVARLRQLMISLKSRPGKTA
ncbi:hypothetical protein GPECTOR_21g603 [Gonium pectorale]|uniref:Clathrin light chain n=1 Tax=Gonium pectorale TaxID=33097 RepID=A0A150GHT9_GONPE|nr:hypothetical protein GPECTOR_21g603 [Gonium pectorale]|eukprot:KXZ49377.1 hypothetical protein GPECTOR_21g603 [Gonium pectorale]